jgi:hypothetical protein
MAKRGFVAVFLVLATSPIFGAENNGCYPTPSDLLAFWPAENTAADVVGVYDGIVEGGTGYGPGFVGDAFDFPGTPGSWVSVIPSPTSASFTIETWIYLASEIAGYQTIYARGAGFWLFDRQLNWWQGGIVYLGNAVLDVGMWYHVAITYDSSTDTLTGYVNGTPDGSVIHTPVVLPSTALMGNNDSAQEPVDGLIDEMSVYGRALEPSEIQDIFTAGSSGKCLIFKGHFETGDTSRW